MNNSNNLEQSTQMIKPILLVLLLIIVINGLIYLQSPDILFLVMIVAAAMLGFYTLAISYLFRFQKVQREMLQENLRIRATIDKAYNDVMQAE